MSNAFWQAKIWGLLHDPLLKPSREDEDEYLRLSQGQHSSDWLKQASSIASASDRALFDLIPGQPDPDRSVTVSHLLSGESLPLSYNWQAVMQLHSQIESAITEHSPLKSVIPPETSPVSDLKQQFWWLWRCLPEVIAQTDSAQLLTPATHILPDVSIWSQASLTAAMAGTLAEYSDTSESNSGDRPYLTVFSFTPVQELIKASRKMRDFWAGSWVLHYLSAKVCWKLAQQYGPDSLIYPSLFQQPLIDHWVLEEWDSFGEWIMPKDQPKSLRYRKLLTAGFPNVIVLLLPQGKVKAAMQTARQTLNEEWLSLGEEVFAELHDQQQWMPSLEADNRTWKGWLRSQWQPYWTALPVGHSETDYLSIEATSDEFESWLNNQNFACNLKKEDHQLFAQEENSLLKAVLVSQSGIDQGGTVTVNAGSWCPYLFDQLRFSLSSVKSARVWKLPTAFGPHSTISGFGPVVYPHDKQKRITETDASQFWGNQWEADLSDAAQPHDRAGLFDGREQLNASETLKRGLHKILHRKKVLNIEDRDLKKDAIAAAYPDLTAGIAGYLKTYKAFEDQQENSAQVPRKQHFVQVCNRIVETHSWAEKVAEEMRKKWGIPWIDDNSEPKKYHSRFLNPGWLVEDAITPKLTELRQSLKHAILSEDATQIKHFRQEITRQKVEYREDIRSIIADYYPNNNPADWYVLAAGDGDGMRRWLKGTPLEHYKDYMPYDAELPEPIHREHVTFYVKKYWSGERSSFR
ncbi:MAG: type III-B CRISPR-associated protein Cas10/Cmr2 [Elainellaceae cyanobacterium]